VHHATRESLTQRFMLQRSRGLEPSSVSNFHSLVTPYVFRLLDHWPRSFSRSIERTAAFNLRGRRTSLAQNHSLVDRAIVRSGRVMSEDNARRKKKKRERAKRRRLQGNESSLAKLTVRLPSAVSSPARSCGQQLRGGRFAGFFPGLFISALIFSLSARSMALLSFSTSFVPPAASLARSGSTLAIRFVDADRADLRAECAIERFARAIYRTRLSRLTKPRDQGRVSSELYDRTIERTGIARQEPYSRESSVIDENDEYDVYNFE